MSNKEKTNVFLSNIKKELLKTDPSIVHENFINSASLPKSSIFMQLAKKKIESPTFNYNNNKPPLYNSHNLSIKTLAKNIFDQKIIKFNIFKLFNTTYSLIRFENSYNISPLNEKNKKNREINIVSPLKQQPPKFDLPRKKLNKGLNSESNKDLTKNKLNQSVKSIKEVKIEQMVSEK